MTTADNKALVKRFMMGLEQFGKTEDTSLIEETFAPDVAFHIAGLPPEMQGREAVVQLIQMFLGAFPDLHIIAVDPFFAQDDLVVGRVSWTGTHLGDLMGIPATGKRVTVADMHIERIANGKIVERYGVTDMMGILQQIGAVPTP